jgi:hypothetical protein
MGPGARYSARNAAHSCADPALVSRLSRAGFVAYLAVDSFLSFVTVAARGLSFL